MYFRKHLSAIREQLPSNGVQAIQNLSGISHPTIYKFFQGKKVHSAKAEKIIEAALKIIEKENEKQEGMKEKLNHVLKNIER